MNQERIVISGIGFVTPAGFELDSFYQQLGQEPVARTQSDYALKDFKPAKHLTNRRMMKNVAEYHGVGMAAIEKMKANSKWTGEECDPYKVGLFVAAPPASVMDHSNYSEPVRKAREIDPENVEREFGATAMESLGTTLLTGLPNNVLCNGAIILNAKGKNDNYLMGETGGHYTVASAVRSLRSGHLKMGFAGSFAFSTDPIITGMYKKTGHISEASTETGQVVPFGTNSDTVFANGAVFISIEVADQAEKRGANRPLADYVDVKHISFASGPFSEKAEHQREIALRGLRQMLAKNNIKADQVGLVFLSAAGVGDRDCFEADCVADLFEDVVEKPAVASTSKLTGNLMEASGLLELVAVEPCYADSVVPKGVALNEEYVTKSGFGNHVSQEKPFVMIMRHSIWSDQMSCLLVKRSEG